MNGEIGPAAEQFLFWEYVNGIFVAVYNLEAMQNPDLGQNTNLRLSTLWNSSLNYIDHDKGGSSVK
jgi:hypothetical protein